MSNTSVAERTTTPAPAAPASKGAVATFQPPRLPFHPAIEDRFGVKAAEWKALVEAVFPMAQSVDSVVLALSYCKARKLDPFKRVVHIVPIYDKTKKKMVDTIWPGIGELRTTAFRTKQYAGADACAFGSMKDHIFTVSNDDGTRRNVAVSFPEWAQLTVYRMIDGQRVPIPGPRVYWLETYSRLGRSELPNDMWQKRPIGQLEKCAEAAALRRAFPEELGDEITSDEAGAHIGPDNAKDVSPERPARAQFQPAEEAQEQPLEPFSIDCGDGEIREFDDPNEAAATLTELLDAATTRDALTGLWESNTLSGQLRERGHEATADALQAAYVEADKAFNAPKADPLPPLPPSPLAAKRGQVDAAWLAWERAAAQRIEALPQAEIAAFLSEHGEVFDRMAVDRPTSWQAIEATIERRKAEAPAA